LYAANTVYGSASTTYTNSSGTTYDELNRLAVFKKGQINGSNNDAVSNWTTNQQDWTLDIVGNQTATESSYYQNTFDKANKLTARKALANSNRPTVDDDEFTTNTAANWSANSGTTFDVNSTNAGQMTVTAVPAAGAIILTGKTMGVMKGHIKFTFPTGTTTGQAGFVFGYKSINDYWLNVEDFATQQGNFYHVVSGTKTLVKGSGISCTAGTPLDFLHCRDQRVDHQRVFLRPVWPIHQQSEREVRLHPIVGRWPRPGNGRALA